LLLVAEAQPGISRTAARICVLPGERLLAEIPMKLTVADGDGTDDPMELLELAARRSGEKILENSAMILAAAKEPETPGKPSACR
jgi:hypothetical protein